MRLWAVRSQSQQSFRDAAVVVLLVVAALSVRVDWNPDVIAAGTVHAAVPVPGPSSAAEPTEAATEAAPTVACPKARVEVEAKDTVAIRCAGERSVQRMIRVDPISSSVAVVRLASLAAS